MIVLSRLLTVTQSIYSKIRLEQFEAQLESLNEALKSEISASISAVIFDRLLKCKYYLIYNYVLAICLSNWSGHSPYGGKFWIMGGGSIQR